MSLTRPNIGETKTWTIRRPTCKICGMVLNNFTGELTCNYGCPDDYSLRTKDNTFYAVYEMTEKFLGDEEYDNSI